MTKDELNNLKDDLEYIHKDCRKAQFSDYPLTLKEFIEIKVADLARTVDKLSDLLYFVATKIVESTDSKRSVGNGE